MRAVAALALALVACGGGDAGSTTQAGNVCGRVVDEAGTPRSDVACQLCSPQICLTAKTGADGRVCFAATRAGAYYFHAFSDDALTYGDVFFPFPLGAEVTAPAFSAALGDALASVDVSQRTTLVAKDGGTLVLGGGIELDVPAGVTVFPDLAKQAEVAGRQVPRDQVDERLIVSHAGEPLAVYVLMPQSAKLKTPGARLTLPSPAGLADGTPVVLALADAVSARLEVEAEATVTGGKVVVPALPIVGWAALYRR